MPQRPVDPLSEPDLWNNVLARLRALERTVPVLPDSAKPLQTYEDGSPLGDTLNLDFGANLQATAIGGDWVKVDALATDTGWDAIVDWQLVVSSPANRLFKGVGEALSYLQATVGLDHAYVLVKGANGFANRYLETANFTAPNTVSLYTNYPSQSPSAGPYWDLAGFGCSSGMGQVYIENFTQILGGNRAAKTFFGTTTGNGPSEITAYRVNFTHSTGAATNITRGTGYFFQCDFPEAVSYGTDGFLWGCDFNLNFNFTMSTTSIYMSLCRIACGNGTRTVTVPAKTMIHTAIVGNNRIGGNIGGSVTFTCSTDNARHDFHIYSHGDGSGSVNLTNVGEARINGKYVSITTTPTSSANNAGHTVITAQVTSTLDVTGPAEVDVTMTAAPTCIIRGKTVNARLVRGPFASSVPSTQILQLIAATFCNIMAAFDATGNTSGTLKPFTIDASSVSNLLTVAGATTFPVAGTDLGTGNLVTVT